MIRGVLFDMDGVLGDSEPLHVVSWQRILEPLGMAVDAAWFQPWIGITDADLAAHLVATNPTFPDATTLLAAKREALKAVYHEQLRPFPGVAEGVAQLRRLLDGRLAVCTSSNQRDATMMLGLIGLGTSFATVVTCDDVSHRKPDPEPYRLAASRLGLAPAMCVAIEDSPHGLASARGAGCRTLAVTTSFPMESLMADACFAGTAEAIAWIIQVVQEAGGAPDSQTGGDDIAVTTNFV